MTVMRSRAPTTDFYKDKSRVDVRDATALVRELERLRPLAELGRMAATVAHEVRNPLAGISANAELLREALSDPDDVESVDVILGEVDRLSSLVNDLLLYTRERPPRSDPIDLSQMVHSAVDLCSSDAADSGVKLHVRGSGIGQGDVELSRQALLNILRNAIQACDVDGSVTLTVAEGRVRVTDTGGGVPEEIRERIFEAFVTGRTRGLGLGAAVARRCLRRQGGDVVLDRTEQGVGSSFVLVWRTEDSALEPTT